MIYHFKNTIVNKCFFNLLILFLITNTTNCYASSTLDVTPSEESTAIRMPSFEFIPYEVLGCVVVGEQSFSLHIKNADIGPGFCRVFAEQRGDMNLRRIKSLTMDHCRFHPANPDEASFFLFLQGLSLNYLTIRKSNLSDNHFCELLRYLGDDLNYLDLSNNQLGKSIQQFKIAIGNLIMGSTFHISTLKLAGNSIDVENESIQPLFREIRKKEIAFQIQEGEPLSGPELDTLVRLLERVGGSPDKKEQIRQAKRISGKLGERGLVSHRYAGAVGDALGKLNFDD